MFKRNILRLVTLSISFLIFFFIFTRSNLPFIKAVETPITKTVSINSKQLKQGEILVVKIKNNQMINEITFNNKKYKSQKEINSDSITTLIPLSYWLTPGDYQLKIIGDNYNISETIKVTAGGFKESYIKVDSDKEEIVRPQNTETIERRKKDNQQISKARQNSSKKRLWYDKFIWPVKGTISSPYGATRFVNGKIQSRHSGIDIAAPEGTAVKAANSGVVKLAEDLLVTGNTIIIDHGWGLSSSYSHLKNINVEKGQEIKTGEIIGTVGSTGFSTGPHLHWAVIINGVFVNPEQFTNDIIY